MAQLKGKGARGEEHSGAVLAAGGGLGLRYVGDHRLRKNSKGRHREGRRQNDYDSLRLFGQRQRLSAQAGEQKVCGKKAKGRDDNFFLSKFFRKDVHRPIEQKRGGRKPNEHRRGVGFRQL